MKVFDAEIIREYARKGRLPTALIEKDYVLSVLLIYISKLPESKDLVFKGGTALRKAYFPGYRLSADLDFTGQIDNRTTIKPALEKLQNTEMEGVTFLKISDMTLEGTNSLRLSVQYESRIGTTPGKRHVDNVKLDFNYGNKIYLAPDKRKVSSPAEYSLDECEICIMRIEEIISEKIHAVYKRPKPRDLYDLNYLLEKGNLPDLALVNRKLEPLGLKFEMGEFTKHVEKLRANWARDMKGLLPAVPPFDKVAKQVLERIGKIL
jgi:predicted nucleotidyltransferase component of viral defense system